MPSPTVYRLLQSHGADFTQGLHGYSNICPPQLCTSKRLQRVEYEYADEEVTCQDDTAVRVYLMSSNPMACAFEPVMRRRVERPVFAEVEGAAVAPEERVGNPLQCKCSHCDQPWSLFAAMNQTWIMCSGNCPASPYRAHSRCSVVTGMCWSSCAIPV